RARSARPPVTAGRRPALTALGISDRLRYRRRRRRRGASRDQGAAPMQLSYSKTFDVTLRPDVLVCGAGCAGIAAAAAAARSGASTLVVERLGFAGGFFTANIGSAFDGFTDLRTGQPVVGGIVFEMLERLG